MTFHAIVSSTNRAVDQLLREACSTRHIMYRAHDPATFDFSHLKPLPAGDMLYRASAPRSGTNGARAIEKYLVHEAVATFYTHVSSAGFAYDASTIVHQYLLFQKNGLSLPRTILHVNTNHELLAAYVEYVGGFPVVLKTTHGSHGIGTMRIDSLPSLYSVLDFTREAGQNVLLQQNIHTNASARLIVVGDRVVDSIEYVHPPDDFRSNVGTTPRVQAKKFSREIEQLAIAATHALNLEAGGVDILVDQSGKAYLAEVNFPFNVARAQNLTGVDTSGFMIDFLVEKSRRLISASS
ncbi:MAG: hypothetical protein A2854_02000 [Parcubacteria group bacterium RIFCSPHIGHO2_01_FULL_56_18]|nr:MAG: hypothetical protein A2854_02000 [Parcubacteria group bacterium RIFCSPHIGHO2_01_FULL_56_18]